MFSQKPKPIRSVSSGSLTKYIQARASLNIYQSTNQFNSKIGFNIENGIEDQI